MPVYPKSKNLEFRRVKDHLSFNAQGNQVKENIQNLVAFPNTSNNLKNIIKKIFYPQ